MNESRLDEYEAIAFLTEVSHESRSDSIKELHNILKSNKGKCVFSDRLEISRGLAVALFDKEIDVRVLGINFAFDFVSCLEDNDDNCIQVLIPAILTCFEDSRSGVQLVSVKALKMCLKKTKDFQSSLSKIVSEGINSKNPKISKTLISKLHVIIADHKKDKNLSPLVQALFNQLSNRPMQRFAFEALKKLKNNCEDKFSNWCGDIPKNSMKIYQHLFTNVKDSSSIDSLMKNADSTKAKDVDFDYPDEHSDTPMDDRQLNRALKFGFLPADDYNLLIKSKNPYEKEDGLYKLKKSVESSLFDKSQLHYFSDFLDFLLKLFDPADVKSTSVCLDIIGTLISAFNLKLKPHLRFLMMCLFPHLCTSMPPIKDEYMKTVLKTFEHVDVKDSCLCLFEFFKHSRTKVRQEAINVMIFALSKFGLEEFDLKPTIHETLNLLLDKKRSVRQAAMECTALLGSRLGPDQYLVDHYLEKIENTAKGKGVTRAVKERLKIRKVPACRPDGTVEYVAISRESGPSVLEWILLAGGNPEGHDIGRSISTNGVCLGNHNGLHSSADASSRGGRSSDFFAQSYDMGPLDMGGDHLLPGTKAQYSHFGDEPNLISNPLGSRSPLGRKYHSAGLVDRLQGGDVIGGKEMMSYNFDQSCNTPASLIESISSTVSSATFPNARKKTSAQKKNVLRMFERLEQKEMEGRKFPREGREEELKIIQSRRCPIKANTDHRMMLNLDFESQPISSFRDVNSSTNHNHDSEDHDPRRDSKSSTDVQIRSSTPMQKSFPGRSDYPLDLCLKDQSSNRLNVTNNQNNSSNHHNPRRVSVIDMKYEMPDAWANKPEAKEATTFKANKSFRNQVMLKKKEQMKENEEKQKEKKLSSIDELIQALNNDNWQMEMAALEKIIEMNQTSPHTIISNLPTLGRAIVKELTNLRSNVVGAALKCLSELFKSLQSSMEVVLDIAMIELLNRTGCSSNNFMRQRALACLYDAIQNVSCAKSINILLNHGSNNKNVQIRNAMSQLVLSACEMLGPDAILCGRQQELTGKIIVAASQFLTDASPDVRASGRKILMNLKGHDQFNQAVRQFVPHEIIVRSVEPALRRMEVKSELEISTPMSAHQRMNMNRNSSLKHNRYHSAGNLCSGTGEDVPAPSPASTFKSKKERHARMDETTLDNILKLTHDLDANDYRERWNGIDSLRHVVIIEGKVSAVATHINKIFDKFVSCLRDPNVKVTIHALQTLRELLPHLSSHMSSVLSMTISTVAINLASNNKEVRDAAFAILDGFTQVMDPAVLLPFFVAAVMNANARYKTEMVDRVSDLVRQVNPQRQKVITLHALPLLWHLLSSMASGGTYSASQTKRSTARLAQELSEILCESLMASANMNSKVSMAMKQMLSDMLNGRYNDL